MNQFNTLDAAMRYRNLGLSIIPLRPKSKKPLLKWKPYQETQATEDELREWFANGATNNIGIVTGAVSGIVVLDVDDPEAMQGRELPRTPMVKTAKGYHYYFKHPDFEVGNKVRFLDGMDVRGDRGFVLAPPSIHDETGERYEWVVGLDVPFAKMPDWLKAAIQSKRFPEHEISKVSLVDAEIQETKDWDRLSRKVKDVVIEERAKVAGAEASCRNDALFKASANLGKFVAGGKLSKEDVTEHMMRASELNGYVHEHSERQALATIRSGLKHGMQSYNDTPLKTKPYLLPNNLGPLPTIRLDQVFNDDEIPSGAMQRVKAEFDEYNHKPSQEHLEGLHQIAKAIEAMALRIHEYPRVKEEFPNLEQSLFVSFLPCGMGKTTTLIATLKHILSMPKYDHVGTIIFLSKLDEIKTLVERLGVSEEEFSVITADAKCNALGNANKREGRVLFTTQQMLERRAKDVENFAEMRDFFYRDKPRQVRVWDEAILPSRTLTLSKRGIMRIVADLVEVNQGLGRCIEDLSDSFAKFEDGELIEMPDISQFGVSLQDALARVNDEDKGYVESLFGLQNLVARVSKDQYGTTTLQYADILPEDIAPMLILDASGQQRKTYDYWSRNRKGIKFLPSPEKSYAGFTIHHWNRGAGKKTQANGDAAEIAKGVARTINNEIPCDKKVLVLHFKASRWMPDMEELVKADLIGGADRVVFSTWGRHTATNDFREYEHVILAGILQYNTAEYEAIGCAVKGQEIKSSLTEEEFQNIRIGEISHHILQAACRGKVRQSIGDGCPPGCHLYIIYSTQKPIGIPGEELMQRIFPGSNYMPWEPVVSLRGKKQKELAAILANTRDSISKKSLQSRLGMDDHNNFNKLLNHSEVRRYLEAEKGILFTVEDGLVKVMKSDMWVPWAPGPWVPF